MFADVDRQYGLHTIHHFADVNNVWLERFNSRFWSPGTEAVDAFSCSWEGETNWLCPLIYLIPRVIQHAKKTHAHGALVAPCWPSAPFWPILFPDGVRPARFITRPMELPLIKGLVLPQLSGSGLFTGIPNTTVLALYTDFRGMEGYSVYGPNQSHSDLHSTNLNPLPNAHEPITLPS